jgi:prepilin-type N-terminal cleavage/methylation domain-containing protein
MKKGFTLIELIISIILISMISIVLIGSGYALWVVKKRVTYSMQYKSMVEDTVRNMVKAEALK